MSVCLRSNLLWVSFPLQSINLQISRLLWARSFLTSRQLKNVDSISKSIIDTIYKSKSIVKMMLYVIIQGCLTPWLRIQFLILRVLNLTKVRVRDTISVWMCVFIMSQTRFRLNPHNRESHINSLFPGLNLRKVYLNKRFGLLMLVAVFLLQLFVISFKTLPLCTSWGKNIDLHLR